MKKATLVVSRDFIKNKIFDGNDKKFNRDNCLAPFISLKEEMSKFDVELCTQDINPIEQSDFVIYNDMPRQLPSKDQMLKSYLLIMESPIIVKSSWDIKKHDHFKKIFTWKDSVIDHKKYFKINYTHAIPGTFNWPLKRKKLCTLISAHKLSRLKNELYSERIKCIRWFEDNHPKDFDLYGMGWDRPAFVGWFKAIKKIPYYEHFFPFKKYPSYVGAVSSKYDTLINYDFAICYENIKDEDGYITEKIFDCFFAGTIPIYWGAINIAEHIPGDCFIDRRKFSSLEDLYAYLVSMSAVEKSNYRQRILQFLTTDQIEKFKASSFAATVCREIIQN